MQSLSADAAQAIAISGLQHMAGDDDLLMRFCNLTGILANEMRQVATERHFLVGVLDFYLQYEPDLMDWTQAQSIDPQQVVAARMALAPNDASGF